MKDGCENSRFWRGILLRRGRLSGLALRRLRIAFPVQLGVRPLLCGRGVLRQFVLFRVWYICRWRNVLVVVMN